MADSVRAAVLVAPGRYEVQEFPMPSLTDGALLMQVEMSGICGTDKHTFLGQTKQYAGTPSETDTPFPIIQGHENVGVVAEISPTAAESIEFYVVGSPSVIASRCARMWCAAAAIPALMSWVTSGVTTPIATATPSPAPTLRISWVAGRSTCTSGPTPSSTRCQAD